MSVDKENRAAKVRVSSLQFLAVLSLSLWSYLPARSVEAGRPAAPAGSLIMRGAKAPAAWADASGFGMASVDFKFGLEVESYTNAYDIVLQAFDPDALYQRFVPSLPASDDVKAKLYAEARFNDVRKRKLFKDAVREVSELHLRFLGVRTFGKDSELLFRSVERQGIGNVPVYVGYVTQRGSDGHVHIADVHRLEAGEMMSQTLRRETLVDLARKGLLTPPLLNPRDKAFLTSRRALELFESRCSLGNYPLIKQAYDQLSPAVQEDRTVLHNLASHGEQSLKDMMVPIERWRNAYPGDPSADLWLVDFYWRLCNVPSKADENSDRAINNDQTWSQDQADGALAAMERADRWFADPQMEIRMARCLAEKQPDQARRLLQQATKRFPVEPSAFDQLLKLDLATANFADVADTLQRQERLFHTNLTAIVASSKDYRVFRQTYPWKKWQHEDHGVDIKTLMAGAAK